MKRIALIFIALALLFQAANAQKRAKKMKKKSKSVIAVNFLSEDFPISELDNKSWETAKETLIGKYWSGKIAPDSRHFKAKLLWSRAALYVRFEANQTEPLIVSETANLKSKTKGLWDRDVCEIFLAPNKDEPRKYFEFEIAPNGEWIDLGIYQKPDERITDWEYNSEMKSKVLIEKEKNVMAIKIEWKAFGKTPKAGEKWMGNIFRCVGSDETRGYLAWQPTKTKTPSFHVPEKFGEFEFVK